MKIKTLTGHSHILELPCADVLFSYGQAVAIAPLDDTKYVYAVWHATSKTTQNDIRAFQSESGNGWLHIVSADDLDQWIKEYTRKEKYGE